MGRILDYFNNRFNYTDFHELNLDWVISTVKDLVYQLDNFVMLNTIKYADPIQWDITRQYEMNTIVIEPTTGTAYISVKAVPMGVGLTNTDYWTVVFTLDINSSNNNLTSRNDGFNPLSTFTSVVGDWLIWNGILYKVIHDIDLGQGYIEGYNITPFTIEDFVKEYINNIYNLIGNLSDLATTDKNSVVAAINENVTSINNTNTKIGNLSDLATTDKDSVVDAINENVTSINNTNTKIGNLSDLATTDKDSVVDAINENVTSINNTNTKIGNLSDLATTDKDSIVDAINEVVSGVAGLYDTCDIRNYGAVGDGITDDTIAFNNCLSINGAVYLPYGNGLKYKLSSIILSSNSTIVGDSGVEIIYSDSGSLFTLQGSHISISNLIVRCSNDGTVFELLNTTSAWYEYIYIHDITTYKAKHVFIDNNSTSAYTNTYLERISGRAMNGGAFIFEHAYAFLFLDNITGDNLSSDYVCDWRTFYFKNCEGAHLVHCEAEGGGSNGSHSSAAGFLFQTCKAIWLERCMSDLVEGSGFWFDTCEYVYVNNCVTSISFGNGFVFTGSKYIVSNCYSNGRKSLTPNLTNANGFYNYATDISISNCYASEMTGYGLAISSGERINISNINISNNAYSLYIAGALSGLIHDIVMMANTVNAITTAITGTLKYYNIWNGSTFENN